MTTASWAEQLEGALIASNLGELDALLSEIMMTTLSSGATDLEALEAPLARAIMRSCTPLTKRALSSAARRMGVVPTKSHLRNRHKIAEALRPGGRKIDEAFYRFVGRTILRSWAEAPRVVSSVDDIGWEPVS